MENMNGLTAVTMILILSFAIDRLVTASLFLLSFNKTWTRRFPDPALLDDAALRARAEKRRKLIYFSFAGCLGILVLAYFGNVRLLQTSGFKEANPFIDIVVTGLILMAGADRIAQIQPKMSGAAPVAEKPAQRPIEITGKLTIEKET